jgi:hypothetical protein
LERRALIVAGASVLALVVLLFPPWRARAIRNTTRYAATPGVEPSTLIDTVAWPIQFAPIFAPPRAALDGVAMHDLAQRSLSGDTSARAELRRRTTGVERRYHAPEVLRTDGEIWRDSVLTLAGIPATSSYDLTFSIDQGWLALRLVLLALIALALDHRERCRIRLARDQHHPAP